MGGFCEKCGQSLPGCRSESFSASELSRIRRDLVAIHEDQSRLRRDFDVYQQSVHKARLAAADEVERLACRVSDLECGSVRRTLTTRERVWALLGLANGLPGDPSDPRDMLEEIRRELRAWWEQVK